MCLFSETVLWAMRTECVLDHRHFRNAFQGEPQTVPLRSATKKKKNTKQCTKTVQSIYYVLNTIFSIS